MTKRYCSFCGKSQHEVKQLIAGPSVFICDECVDLCAGIVAEQDALARISALEARVAAIESRFGDGP